ncbi:MAG: hypothetical protein HGA20_14970 [Geobacteraceae bacterium]|nr:hypothetical protein [Geobacteraceae bacterium]
MAVILYTFQTAESIPADCATIQSLNVEVVLNALLPSAVWSDATRGTLLTQFCQSMLDNCQAGGLRCALWLGPLTQRSDPKLTELQTLVNTFKNHPALYGWYTEDEPKAADIPVPGCENVYDTIKAADPFHPVVVVYPGYGAGFWPAGTTAYPIPTVRRMYDVFGIDNYHSGTTFTNEITASYGSVPARDRGNLINALQVFNNISASTLTANAASSYTVGWATGGIAFWMWRWYDGTYQGLQTNPTLWPTVAALALQYRVSIAATVNGSSIASGAITARIQLDSQITGIATVAPCDIISGIIMAGGLSGTGLVSGAIPTKTLKFDGSITAAGLVVHYATDDFLFEGAPAGSAGTNSALTTAISLGGNCTAQSSATSDLTELIPPSLKFTVAPYAVGNQIYFGTDDFFFTADHIIGSAAAYGTATTGIKFNGNAPAASSTSAAIASGISFAGAPAGSGYINSAVTTKIALGGLAPASCSAYGTITTGLLLAAGTIGTSTTTSSLDGHIFVAGGTSGTSQVASLLSTGITLAGSLNPLCSVLSAEMYTYVNRPTVTFFDTPSAQPGGTGSVQITYTTQDMFFDGAALGASAVNGLTLSAVLYTNMAAALLGQASPFAQLATGIALAGQHIGQSSTLADLTAVANYNNLAASLSGTAAPSADLLTAIALSGPATGQSFTTASFGYTPHSISITGSVKRVSISGSIRSEAISGSVDYQYILGSVHSTVVSGSVLPVVVSGSVLPVAIGTLSPVGNMLDVNFMLDVSELG